jgi:hypothetical protein
MICAATISRNLHTRLPGAVLKLTLWPTRYKWQFIDATGLVLDRGQDLCHQRAHQPSLQGASRNGG